MLFQSSPLSQEGRYLVVCGEDGTQGCFNPRPSRKRGATRLKWPACVRCRCFNPRPSRKRGATRTIPPRKWPTSCFNPRPSRKRGATLYSGSTRVGTFVSILAPLARGALLLRLRRPDVSDHRFNPRPSRKRGATDDVPKLTENMLVSILAPLARGALRIFYNKSPTNMMFQSSPLSQEGRYGLRHDQCTGSGCFNPRPSRKRGATIVQDRRWRLRLVSILAPLARGALPTEIASITMAYMSFNPRPSRKRGATSRPASPRSTRMGFNPRPSRKRGATP